MTEEIIDYPTRELLKIGYVTMHTQGMRALHTDFINNDESQGYRVTFVDGTDDPNNDPALVAKRDADEIEQTRVNELILKLDDSTITASEIKEFLKLKFVRGK